MAQAAVIFPSAPCSLDSICQNGVARKRRLELVHIIHRFLFTYRTKHTELATAVWRPWTRNHPMCFSRVYAAGSRGKAKVATSFSASMVRACVDTCNALVIQETSKLTQFKKSGTLSWLFLFLIVYNFTHDIKSLAESLSSTGQFGLSLS